jgi:hypothetical protein
MRSSNLESLESRRLFSGLPMLSIGDATVVEGNAGTTNAAIVVSLAGSKGGQAVTVNYSTQDGTAVAGSDYSAASGKLTFAAGETTKTILIPIKGDRVAEDGEYFLLTLQGAKNAKIARSQGDVAILDDEPRITLEGSTAYEGNSGTAPLAFTVKLSNAFDQAVTVNYATQNGSAVAGTDFQNTAGSVTFAAGETSKTVPVPLIGDRLPESDEYFYVALSGPSANAAIGWNAPVLCTILDDEPRISIYGPGDSEGDSGTKSFVFTVKLERAYDQPITLNYATHDDNAVAGVDYLSTSGALTFEAGETTKTIGVQVIGNATPEPAKSFRLDLSGASANATFISASAYATIYDDDGYPVEPPVDDGGGYYDWFDYVYYGW